MADNSSRSGIHWVVIAALAIGSTRLCATARDGLSFSSSGRRAPASVAVPDFKSLEDLKKHADLAKALAKAEGQSFTPSTALASSPAATPAEASPPPSGMRELEPLRGSEPGVRARLDTSGETARVLVRNEAKPGAFLGAVTVRLDCTGSGGYQQTVSVGHLRPHQQASAPLDAGVFKCIVDPRFEAHARRRWDATPAAAEALARSLLMSADRPADGALEMLAAYFAVPRPEDKSGPSAGRALLLLAARGNADAARALAAASPTSRDFLLRALPAISDPTSALYAMLCLPDSGAAALRLDPAADSAGREDAIRVAIEHDGRLPREARLAVERGRLLALEEARDRYDTTGRQERLRQRQRAAREAVAAALASFPEEEVARALVREMGRLSEEEARPLVAALGNMPRSGAAAAAHRLAHPTGEERFFAFRSLAAALPDLVPALRRELAGGLPGLEADRVEDELRRRYQAARAEQAELFWARARERFHSGAFDEGLESAEAAVALGHAAPGLGAFAVEAARQRGDAGDFAAALAWLREAGRLGESEARIKALRAELEGQVLEGMFLRGVAREGPGPEYRPIALEAGPIPPTTWETQGWKLAWLRDRAGFLPAGAHTYRGHVDPELVRLPPGAVLERLEALERLGIAPAGAFWLRARAGYQIASTPVIVVLAVLALFAGLALVLVPARAGPVLFALGLQRAGIRLGRWGFARDATFAAVAYARMLVRRAEAFPAEAGARLAAAWEAVEIFGMERDGKALAGRIALLRGERERAFRLHSEHAELPAASGAGWARRMAHFDLARLALCEERYADAAAHAARAGGAQGALLCGAAGLAAGSPRLLRPLLRAALSRRTRPAALELLAHAWLERDCPTLAGLVLRLAPRRSHRSLYARARREHGLGRSADARALYAELARLRPGHGGARLGEALLSGGDASRALEELAASDQGDAAAAARGLLARRDLARGEPAKAAQRLKLPRAAGPQDLELLGVAEAAAGNREAANEAFWQAAARSGRRADRALAAGRRWALAARALGAGRHEVALAILGADGDPALVAAARAGAICNLLRREPHLGLGDAARRATGQELRADQPEPLPLSLAIAARCLARGELEAASGSLQERLREIDDPVARLFLAAARSCPEEDGAELDRLHRDAVAARPSLAPAAAVLVAAAHLAAKRPEPARRSLRSAPLEGVRGTAAVHAARMAAELDVELPGPLLKPFQEARRGRALEASRLLDALEEARSPALLRVRASLARAAALARVEVADYPGAAAELQRLWNLGLPGRAGPSGAGGEGAGASAAAEAALQRARVDTGALRDALAELSLDAFPRLATSEPARALRLLEHARELPAEEAPKVLHDKAVSALGACLQAGSRPPPGAIQSLGHAFDRLLGQGAALAYFRLRRLELAGDGPPPPGDFEADVRLKAVEALAAYLVYLVEQGHGSQVRAATEPWKPGSRDGSGFGEALRHAADAIHAEARELFERTSKVVIPGISRTTEAVTAWHALDGRMTTLLTRLRDLRAEASLLEVCEDSAARCCDAFSVQVYNAGLRGPLPLLIIERGLGLAHAEHLREHLLQNRKLMAGAGGG